MTELNLIGLSPYLFLFISVLLTLSGDKPRGVVVTLVISLLLAFFTNTISGLSALSFLGLPIAMFIWVNHFFADLLRKIGFVFFLAIGYLLITHQVPGVNNYKIFDQLLFADGMAAFDLFLNYDKVYLAVVMLAILPTLDRTLPFSSSYGLVAKYFLVSFLVLFPAAYSVSYIKPHLNLNPYMLLWALNNFFFVCFAEEVIFRRFIQNYLVSYFRNVQYGDLVAIFLGALIFGVAHMGGGLVYVGLAILAGIFYGLCFYHSCNVRSSMLLHFLVNLCHALFFTYPYAV